MGFLRRAIDRDRQSHADFIAPPPYIENARQAREAEKERQLEQRQRAAAHQQAKFAARQAKADREAAERAEREQEAHTRRLAAAVVDEIVRRR